MATKIAVAARLRPWIDGEVHDDTVVVSENGGQILVTEGSKLSKFSFKHCYGQDSTQSDIFDKDVKPLISNVFRGLMVTVFAYGVTSSGKTHTMQGTPENPGVIPRVVETLLDKRASLSASAQDTLTFHLSYMEVYKDDVYDLFIERQTASKLSIMTNEHGKTIIPRLTHRKFSEKAEFDELYATACKARSVASTNLNRASSRSHAILGITVNYADESTGMGKTSLFRQLSRLPGIQVLTGRINLVDLAGSENNKMTGNDPSRMAESSAINKSLTTLGMVVKALNRSEGRIPYRDSKLTRILQDALGGSSIGLLICNLAPGKKFMGDTINTLNFAGMAKSIENRPVVNERAIVPPVLSVRMPAAPAPTTSTSGQSRRGSIRPVPAGATGIPAPPAGTSRRMSHFPAISQLPGLSEAEIEERIAKRVEMEVSKRLEEKQREREEAKDREVEALRLEMEKERERREELERLQELRKECDVAIPEEPTVEVHDAEMEGEQIDVEALSEDERVDEEMENSDAPADPIAADKEESPISIECSPTKPDPPMVTVTVPEEPEPEPCTPQTTSSTDSSKGNSLTLPSQVLDSLLYKHNRTPTVDLLERLADVEQRYGNGDHLELANLLSPASKHKVARAYVEIARSSQDQAETKKALDMYKKAAAYKPDSQKLSQRIFEMELAVIQGVAHQPRRKSHKSSRTSSSHAHKQSPYEGDRPKSTKAPSVLGEVTNSPRKHKVIPQDGVKHGVENGTPQRGVDSPGGEDWFMAPRKGAIGKAR